MASNKTGSLYMKVRRCCILARQEALRILMLLPEYDENIHI